MAHYDNEAFTNSLEVTNDNHNNTNTTTCHEEPKGALTGVFMSSCAMDTESNIAIKVMIIEILSL